MKGVIANLELHIHERERENAELVNEIRVLTGRHQQNDEYLREIENLNGKLLSLQDHINKSGDYLKENGDLTQLVASLENRLKGVEQDKAVLIEEVKGISGRSNES